MDYKLKALWSESAEFDEDVEYSVRELQDQTARIDAQLYKSRTEGSGTRQEIKYRLELRDCIKPEGRIFEGKQDLGDGIGGFIDHIEKTVEEEYTKPEHKSSAEFIRNILISKLRRQYMDECIF